MYLNVKTKLEQAIHGRESSDEWVKVDSSGRRDVAIALRRVPVNIEGELIDVSFVIHADCKCSAIDAFLKKATLDTLTLSDGPQGGKVLGVSGQSIPGFYAYKD